MIAYIKNAIAAISIIDAMILDFFLKDIIIHLHSLWVVGNTKSNWDLNYSVSLNIKKCNKVFACGQCVRMEFKRSHRQTNL